MGGTAVANGVEVTMQQKQAALEAVLHSHTFARADQLKSFLKFVCEMELNGKGAELSEYLIGVEALGRSPNYSPADDSAVRNRAFALRKKLLEFYEQEDPTAELRIEMTKGSYCPHFVPTHLASLTTAQESETLDLALVPVIEPTLVPSTPSRPTIILNHYFPAFLLGILLTMLVGGGLYFLLQPSAKSNLSISIAPIIAEAWGPLLGTNADPLICVANPPNLAIHERQGIPSADPNVTQASPELERWIKNEFHLTNDVGITLSTTTNGTYWGDSLGAMAALKTLTTAGHTAHIFPEKVTTIPTLRRRNVILIGAPEYSPAIKHFLEKCPLTVEYLRAIVSRDAAATANYSIKRDGHYRAKEVFGLITVLPSDSSTGDQHRTVIFSGVNSAGAQAAAEFFASPENLLELQKQFQKEGYDHFPSAYQVVVKVEPDDNILLNFKYETHRVIQR